MISEYVLEKFAHFDLQEDEIEELIKILRITKFKRHTILLAHGEPVQFIAMLLKGTIYSSHVDESGKEYIRSFHYPASTFDIVFNYQDFKSNLPSQLDYKVLTEATLLCIDLENIRALCNRFPKFYKFEIMIMRAQLVATLQSLHILQSKNAVDKIKLFMDYAPQVFQLFPYYYIASYLGIHRNTFKKAMSNL